jgi:hypothetical protein
VLLTREEQTYDFGGARFDLQRDRDVLAWIFSQFLFGEVTGVQVGEWLARAPDFDAAQFLGRQANEEMAHVKLFLRILRSLEAEPQPPHPALKFLATDFAGGTFVEHTCLEMALGEGFVLMAIYALIDTLPESEIRSCWWGCRGRRRATCPSARTRPRRSFAAIRHRPATSWDCPWCRWPSSAGWPGGPAAGTAITQSCRRCRGSGPRPARPSSGSGGWASSAGPWPGSRRGNGRP